MKPDELRYHELSRDQLESLSYGLGGTSIVAELFASRVSIGLLLFRDLVTRWTDQTGPDPRLEAAAALLGEVQDARPEIYTELFGDPLVAAWLTRALRAETLTERDVRQVGGLAAAAAVRAGLAAEAAGYLAGGRTLLPTVGVADLDDGPVVLAVAPDRPAPTLSSIALRWHPARFLSAGSVSIRLEDLSPFRDGYHAPPSPRVSEAETAEWRETFAEAWQLLDRYAPERTAELAVGLRAIVPLVDLGDGSSRSGTARESVGAIGMSRPSSPVDFAITLVHEFQHSKLSAILDLVPLYRRGGTELHVAPWRVDPRPTSGLIQGVYAFLSIADTWRRLRAAPAVAAIAEREFTRVRDQVATGLAALEDSAELTPSGEAFVRGIRIRLDQLLAEPAGAGHGADVSGIRRQL
jgi:HEXXH motif-containing protein